MKILSPIVLTFCLVLSSLSHAAGSILIKHVSYWTAGLDAPKGPVNILIEGDIIREIGHGVTLDNRGTVIDAAGKTLIPGLIDTHIHVMDTLSPQGLKDTDHYYLSFLAAQNARVVLMNGVTTIREAAGPSMGLRRAIDEGLTIGPRIYPSGAAITQSGGHGDFRNLTNPAVEKGGYVDETEAMGLAYIADGRAQVLRGAREQLRQGATQLKMLTSGAVSGLHDPLDVQEFNYDEIRAAVQAAENWGTYVMVHAYNDRSIETSLKAGVKSIEHGNLISEPTMQLLAEKGAFLSTQTYTFTVELPYFTSDQRAKLRQAREGLGTMFKLAKKYGVTITHSTDIYGSPENFAKAPEEFKLRQQWFTPIEILEQATANAAKLVALSGPRNPYAKGPLGIIEKGAYADLLIVDGDPTADVGLLADPKANLLLVMKGGEIFKNELE